MEVDSLAFSSDNVILTVLRSVMCFMGSNTKKGDFKISEGVAKLRFTDPWQRLFYRV
jgi:hypothetical protein